MVLLSTLIRFLLIAFLLCFQLQGRAALAPKAGVSAGLVTVDFYPENKMYRSCGSMQVHICHLCTCKDPKLNPDKFSLSWSYALSSGVVYSVAHFYFGQTHVQANTWWPITRSFNSNKHAVGSDFCAGKPDVYCFCEPINTGAGAEAQAPHDARDWRACKRADSLLWGKTQVTLWYTTAQLAHCCRALIIHEWGTPWCFTLNEKLQMYILLVLKGIYDLIWPNMSRSDCF